jgi:hypothetical protein
MVHVPLIDIIKPSLWEEGDVRYMMQDARFMFNN